MRLKGEVEEAVMYQHNPSATYLENNGILSSDNRAKHICIRYFLIKYGIEMDDLKVKYFRRGKCWPNTLPNHCKVLPTKISDVRFWDSQRTPQI